LTEEEGFMKKQIVIAAILGLAALAARGQTAKLTAPKSGEPWALNTSQTITWTWSGSAQIKLVLVRQNGSKLGIIKSGLQLSSGGYIWKVGTLENGTIVPAASDYMIRLITMDSKNLQMGPAFAITAPGQPAPPASQFVVVKLADAIVIPPQPKTASPIVVTVTQPGKGVDWIPLKTNYSLKWEWTIPGDVKDTGGPTPNCTGCPVHVWMVPVAAPSQKVLLTSNLCSAWNYCGQGAALIKYSGTYAGLTPSLATGNYFFRVAWSSKQGFYGDSQPFAVKSVISDDSAYLGPDPLQEEVDFDLRNVYFDADGNLVLRIKNLGQNFSGNIPVSYEKQAIGNFSKLMAKGETSVSFTANTNEEKNVILFKWTGYNFYVDRYNEGAYIPDTTRPFSLKIKISPAKDFNPNNNAISKELCMIKDPDIGTDGEIKLTFSPKEWVTIKRGTSNQIHEAKMKWLSENTFEAELEVDLWNYGAKTKTFDCWIYADQLPGQIVAKGITLQPGYKMTWKQPVKIKLQSRCGAHKLVFIADPNEHQDEPYPNSYQNNFINVILNILCGGAIQGAG